MAWEGSTRRGRLPKDWAKRRAVVLKRDPTCRLRIVCRGAPSTEADHRQPGDDHGLDNLQGACLPCHLKKSGAEGGRAPHRRSPHQRRRPPEAHPGILESGPMHCLHGYAAEAAGGDVRRGGG